MVYDAIKMVSKARDKKRRFLRAMTVLDGIKAIAKNLDADKLDKESACKDIQRYVAEIHELLEA